MIIGLIAFLFSAIGTWSAMHYYVYKNLASVGINKPFLIGLLWVFALLVPLSRFLTLRWRNSLVSFIHWVSMVWIGSVFLFSFWLLVSSVLRSGIYSFGFGGKIDPVQWISVTALAVLSMILWAAYQVFNGPKNVPFDLDRSPRYQKNLKRRFVQISDVHLGLTLGTAFLESLVKKINSLEPDMIL